MAITAAQISSALTFENEYRDITAYNHSVLPLSGGVIFDTSRVTQGVYSALYDGSGGHMAMAANDAFNLGLGAYTIEFSFYATNNSARFQSFISSNNDTYINGSLFIQLRTNGTVTIGGRDFTERPNSPVTQLNRWYDVCITRNEAGTLWFLVRDKVTDQTSITSYNADDIDMNLNGVNGVSVGRSIWDGSDGIYHGNIDAVRIVKGFSVFDELTQPERLAYRNWYDQDELVFGKVAGNVTLDGQPYGTRVVATQFDPNSEAVFNNAIYGESTSDPVTGEYTIDGFGSLRSVLIHSVQDFGLVWESGRNMAIGDVVHPTASNGYVYRVTGIGVTGGTEPIWIAEPEAVISDGSVMYTSEVLLAPKIEGYITPTRTV